MTLQPEAAKPSPPSVPGSTSPPPLKVRRAPSRNADCPCNSGLRYKHCCGAAADSVRREHQRGAALRCQQRGEFFRAIEAYAAFLQTHPDDWEVAHMHATCLYQIGAIDAACIAFEALLATPAAETAGFWTNLGLVLASTSGDPSSRPVQEQLKAYRALRPFAATPALEPARLPGVSVVLPAHAHADYVAEAIASVFAQTLAPLELIVIDDGSRDATLERCEAALRGARFPVRLLARENRGAAATLNEGIDLARGEFIQLLNSDDRLPSPRIAIMLRALLALDAQWGFARVALIDRHGLALGRRGDARAAALIEAQDAAVMSPTAGLALMRANSAISSGNLMFSKALWQAVGGFRDYRYNHDWDFCLRAALHAEPVLVPQALYDYRLHGSNTISENSGAPRAEMREVMAAFVRHAQQRTGWPNPFAPTLANWGDELVALLGAIDALWTLPRPQIELALRSRTGLAGAGPAQA